MKGSESMFHIKLAGYDFTIDNHYEYIERLCQDYINDKSGEMIKVSEDDIKREGSDDKHWPLDYLESLAIYRQICERLISRNIILFHCSALQYNGNAYLFTAPSGTGKSTHARLWREYFGDQVKMINDDKPLLHVCDDGIDVYGSPFAGKEGLQEDTFAPVKGIVILHQSKENTIRRLSSKEAFPLLLSQTYRSQDPHSVIKTLEMVQLLSTVPVYALGCNISYDAVKLVYENLNNENI